MSKQLSPQELGVQEDEQLIDQEYGTHPQIAGRTGLLGALFGDTALVLTRKRVALCHRGGETLWSCPLKDVESVYLTHGASRGEWIYATLFAPAAFPLTLLLFFTRRLGIRYRDDSGRSCKILIHLSRRNHWRRQISEAVGKWK